MLEHRKGTALNSDGGATSEQASEAYLCPLSGVLDQEITTADGMFIACGEFLPGSIHGGRGGKADDLSGVVFILLDADLSDFLELDKRLVHEMSDQELNEHLEDLTADLREVCQALGIPIHRLVSSGYGIQAHVVIRPEDRGRVKDIHGLPEKLIDAVNREYGAQLADPGAGGAGTRKVRLPGSENRKNATMPREVRLLHSFDEIPLARLDDLRAIVPRPERTKASKLKCDRVLNDEQFNELVARVSAEFTEGARQSIAVGLAGMLAKAGVDEADAENLIDHISDLCGDEESSKRRQAVSATYSKVLSGRQVSGYWRLKSLLSEELLQYLSETLPAAQNAPRSIQEPRQGQYMATSDGMVHLRPGNGGITNVPLCNFNARIVEDLVIDDGREQTREFVITGEREGKQLPRVNISSREFAGMNWVTEKWGARAIIHAGFATASSVRTAIQSLSEGIEERVVHQHPGWIEHADHGWLYLHADGAIGANGRVEGVEVRMPRGAVNLRLPPPADDEAVRHAIRASLHLFQLAPAEAMTALLGAAYRAPLASMLAPDLGIFVVGPSGSQKSELAALVMQHFGPEFVKTALPAQWSSSDNALERIAFDFKDAPLVIDDFNPTGTQNQVAVMHRTAERVFRAAGNRSGRSRMQANLAFRESFPPRGLVIGTGEDLPNGYSLKARLFIVELARGDVDLLKLTECQERAGRGVYATATAAYVQWLAANYETVSERLPERFKELRSRARHAGAHDRTPEAVAHLALGWQTYLDFAVAMGALSQDEANATCERAWHALESGGRQQREHQQAEEPAEQALNALRSVLSSGAGHLARRDPGQALPDAGILAALGWRDDSPQGACIGWFGGEDVYLDLTSAMKAMTGMTNLPLGGKTISRRLAAAGYIKSKPPASEGGVAIRLTISGVRRSVLHMGIGAFGIDTAAAAESSEPGQLKIRKWEPSGSLVEGLADEPAA